MLEAQSVAACDTAGSVDGSLPTNSMGASTGVHDSLAPCCSWEGSSSGASTADALLANGAGAGLTNGAGALPMDDGFEPLGGDYHPPEMS